MKILVLVASTLIVGLVTLRFAFSRYKRCPSDRVLVIYGKTGKGGSSRCVHGGASFVWPVFQDYQFLDLTPLPMDIKLAGALSKDSIRVEMELTCTVGISTESGVVEKAAERLLGLDLNQIRLLGQDIVIEEMRAVIASMNFESINADRDLLIEKSVTLLQAKLKEIGLCLININIQKINRTSKDGEVEWDEVDE